MVVKYRQKNLDIRNMAIVIDYNQGMSISDLKNKYSLTKASIYAVLKKVGETGEEKSVE